MKQFLEDALFWIIGIPVVLLFSLLWLVCRIFGIRLEEDF